MFLKPVITTENINQATRLGIEIEICIKKEKYASLGYIGKKPEVFNFIFKGKQPFKIGAPYLNDIILTTDPSCICPEGFVNAEIISPKMDYIELPIYLNFLKTVVFNNSEDFLQGETCGIHIHWSNNDMVKYKDNDDYLFFYFKLIQNIREKLSLKIVGSHFSGRQFYYGKPEKSLNFFLDDLSTTKKFVVFDNIIKVENYKKKTLIHIKNEINMKEIIVYSFIKSIPNKDGIILLLKQSSR